MQIDVMIDRTDDNGRNYLTWAPVRARLRRTDPVGATGLSPVTVRVANRNATGGQLVFGTTRAKPGTATLQVRLAPGAPPAEIWVAGSRASVDDLDAGLSITGPGGAELASKAVMVRVRKDANLLTPAERDRFTRAFAQVNDKITGVFKNFREMHKDRVALDQAHTFSAFLPWHRAYLLDLERELQRKDKAVTLPFWRFDRPAPNVFHPEFMGRPTQANNGTLTFAASNLLSQWQSDGPPGISRRFRFAPLTSGANVSNQATTLALGGPRPNAFFDNGGSFGEGDLQGFRTMEGDPHGFAHTSFLGVIADPGTAPRDPLFFLLHCNVDRLWALWQRTNDRFDGTKARTYFFQGSFQPNTEPRFGHHLKDTMWPWDGITRVRLRPPNAPRPAFAVVPTAAWPPPKPMVGDMIDYQGLLTATSDMNFAYADVPYGATS